MNHFSHDKPSSNFNEYAVIDLGSNSFHLIIAREINGALQVIHRLKQHVHLASGLNNKKELDNEAIERGINCLSLFSERLKDFPAENVRIVATYTLRVATNRNLFLKAAVTVIPYPIEIISGQEEARLIYCGVSHTVSTLNTKLVIDIGGGSTELAVGTKFNPTLVDSRAMGCVTFTQQFFSNQKITLQAFNKAKLAAEQQMEKINALIIKSNVQIAFGTSGTIKSVQNILLDMGVLDGIITAKRLNDLVSYVLEFNTFDDIDFPSLSEERKSVFVAGLAILSGVFDSLKLQELHYCSSALREGVLYEMTDKFRYHDIRQRTALALSKQYHIDKKHAQKIVNTAKYFYKEWQRQVPKSVINPILEPILYWSALLHEIGLHINYSSIHKHSAYILQNSKLPGFNEEQQQLLATLVRYHRKSIKEDNIPEFNLYEQKQIMPLMQILRLAVLVNNQRHDLPMNVFKLLVNESKTTHLELIINEQFAEENRLILLDLEQEQEYWFQVKDWQLDISIK